MKSYFFLLSIIISVSVFSQQKMRNLNELINNKESAWTLIKTWIDSAKNTVEVLDVDSARGAEALYKTQVTTRSPMGAIIYRTGGILIDHGWVRILGSGNKKLDRSLPEWNKGKTFYEFGQAPAYLLIADDVLGGFFMLNGGELGNDPGKVYYFSPDNLEFEPLNLTYTDFLSFCFSGNLDLFYKGYRWSDWKKEISNLDGNKVYNFFSYLWTKEGQDINKTSRKIVSVEEVYFLHLDFRKQLGLSK